MNAIIIKYKHVDVNKRKSILCLNSSYIMILGKNSIRR